MKYNELISVIVCVYNVEKYLTKCIESIINQSYKNLEIILIDDGSTDESGRICDNYAKRDSRIKVIHQKNKGVSATRNVGLKAISGNYFGFVDSDDYLCSNYYSNMYEAMINNNADLVFCDILQINTLTNKEYLINKEVDSFICNSKKDILSLLFKESRIINPINKLYKKSIFNDLKYPSDIIHEDTFLIIDILNKCNCVVYINEPLYNRIIHNNSIMTSKTNSRIQEIISYNHWLETLTNDYDKNLYNLCIIKILNSIINNYCYLYDELSIYEKEKLKIEFNKYLKLKSKPLPIKYKIKFFIFKHFDFILILKKKKGVL